MAIQGIILKYPKAINITQKDLLEASSNNLLQDFNGIYITEGIVLFRKHPQDPNTIVFPSGSLVFLEKGIVHKDIGPAALSKNSEGEYSFGYYVLNGKYDRGSDPTFVKYKKPFKWNGKNFFVDEKNEVLIYQYRLDKGLLHNLYGPAMFDSTEFQKEIYYIEGRVYNQEQFENDPSVRLAQGRESIKSKMKNIFEEGT